MQTVKQLQLVLHRPDSLLVHANLQSMTNGNTSYHTDLPGSNSINMYLPTNIQNGNYLYCLETDSRSTYPLEGAGGRWRVLEGTGELMLKRTPLLVRKCADGVVVSIRYDVMVVWI